MPQFRTPPRYGEDFLRNGSPAGVFRESFPQTADQTSTAWAANTAKTLALATPQLISTPGIYYASIMVKATTVCSLVGRTVALAGASTGSISGQAILAQTSGSALAATAPATIASATTSALVPYAVIT